ncbi:MAG: prepilin-type N-terminal cleavage/methylation domain-containing protein [Burkholderiales bacterium]|nr:prepilin-type N-terminal cleavage/methylation domain-containing protein [Burkholderiales bacterium]
MRRGNGGGFTLIELLVVMAVIALLLSIAAPRYFHHVHRSKEAVLKENLLVMRDALDKFHGDRGKYPETLSDLVTLRYLRAVPVDPITDSPETWIIVPPPVGMSAAVGGIGAVYDIRSGSTETGSDGTRYDSW